MEPQFEFILGFNKKEKEDFFSKEREIKKITLIAEGEFWEEKLIKNVHLFLEQLQETHPDRLALDYYVGNNFSLDEFRITTELIDKHIPFLKIYTENFSSSNDLDRHCYIMQSIYRSEEITNYCRIQFEYQEKEAIK